MLFHYQIKQYYLYFGYTDMRKGIDSLCGLVRSELRKNPLLGDAFIFINRRRNQIKLLHWQGDGFAVFYKRLESGTYELPVSDKKALEITSGELHLILDGIQLSSVKKRPRYERHFVDKLLVNRGV